MTTTHQTQPVEPEMIDNGARCAECGHEFTDGDTYARARATAAEAALAAALTDTDVDPGAVMAACVDCALLPHRRRPASADMPANGPESRQDGPQGLPPTQESRAGSPGALEATQGHAGAVTA